MTRLQPRILPLMLALLTTASCGWAVEHSGRDDEPNELSWEHFSTCLECFRDFADWTGRAPDRWSRDGGRAERRDDR